MLIPTILKRQTWRQSLRQNSIGLDQLLLNLTTLIIVIKTADCGKRKLVLQTPHLFNQPTSGVSPYGFVRCHLEGLLDTCLCGKFPHSPIIPHSSFTTLISRLVEKYL
jgi:hypothetical protein